MAITLAQISHRHEGLLRWLVLNPDRSLTECAKMLGYTLPWVSQVVHSDMFQAKYKEMCREAGVDAIHTINNKLSAVTAQALENTMERLSKNQVTERFLGDTLKTTLQALGYGGPQSGANGGGTSQHLHVHVDAQALVDAREMALALKDGSTQAKVAQAPRSPCDGLRPEGGAYGNSDASAA